MAKTINKIWRDKQGRVVLWQRPNAWILIWALAELTSFLISRGKLTSVIHWIGSGALIIWALLEIFRGVNYFRRTLGLVVLVVTAVSILKSIM